MVATPLFDYPAPMSARSNASLHIRRLNPVLQEALRLRAGQNGRTLEDEARAILETALVQPASGAALVQAIRRRFGKLGGIDLELPPREMGREPPRFE